MHFTFGRVFRYTFLLVLLASSHAYSSIHTSYNSIASGTAVDSVHIPMHRVYTTQRLTTPPPVIDGKLNDPAWKTGHWSTHFTQFTPTEHGKPSKRTELKILYDDQDIYVAIRAFDDPGKIQRIAGTRDEIIGDIVGVNFDSYNDDETGYEFDLTAYGQKIDLVLTNPGKWDVNWNAVWKGKVGINDSSWVAEMKIPFSQLHYSSDSVQTWGLHVWRWINRLKEEDDWEVQTKTGPGMIYNFGVLKGIKDLKKMHRIEIMPYALGKLKTFKANPSDPFTDKGRSWDGNMGLNAKIGVTSNLTLNMAINPDFGQVEADPSVMNLTNFETFYQEKRPFFIEGKNIFDYSIDNNSLFYSRRIGHAPSNTITPTDSLYVKEPEQTTILSAIKLSGKTSKNLSVGVLQSLTARENAKLSGPNRSIYKKPVEPLTNYMVARIQKNYHDGNTIIGGILTSTNRFIRSSNLDFLSHDAYTSGFHVLHQWDNKRFYIDTKLIGSNIKGDPRAITMLQESSARYYQRPGAAYLNFDTTKTSLSGYGGKFEIGKGTGLWHYSTGLSWYSPGLELNDLGYMKRADLLNQHNKVSYFVTKPESIFRTLTTGLEEFNHWNFGGQYLGSGVNFTFSPGFLNKWGLNTNWDFNSQMLDTRILRGGYALKMPSNFNFYGQLTTNDSRDVSVQFKYNIMHASHHSADRYQFGPGITARIIDNFRLGVTARYTGNHNRLQYVTTVNRNAGNRYILGTIKQQTLDLTLRFDYIITPNITIQYYGSPFVSRGKYADFKYISQPRAHSYNDRFVMYNKPVFSNNRYYFDENGDHKPDYSIANPDFNFRQFRSNLVLRWRYRPGSDIYLVWSRQQTAFLNNYNADLGHSMRRLFSIVPHNVFLLKINYWFSL